MNWFLNCHLLLLILIPNTYVIDLTLYFYVCATFWYYRSEPGEWREQNAEMIVTMSFKNVFVTIHCKISRSMNVQVSHYAYVYVASHSLSSKMCWTSTKTDTAVIVGWQFNKMQNLTEKKNSTGKRNCIIIILCLSDNIRRCGMKQQLNMLLMRNNSSSGGSKRHWQCLKRCQSHESDVNLCSAPWYCTMQKETGESPWARGNPSITDSTVHWVSI